MIEKVSSSSLIKVGGTNFFNMKEASDISSLEASAPAYHRNVTRALIASGKQRPQDPIIARAERMTQRMQEVKFKRGMQVLSKSGKKLTIIHANVGHTKLSNIPVHRLVDKNGNICLEKETELTPRLKT